MTSTRPDLPPALRSRPPAVGDTVVHLDYGLCRLGRPRRIAVEHGTVDTIELRFAKGEARHVPMTDLVRIWNYGASLPKSRLDRIGSEDWTARQGERLREIRTSLDIVRQAKARRVARSDQGLVLTEAALTRAAEGFPHDLTPDQTEALAEIVADITAAHPMNRVLIGDVGCGKTEVAVQAALASALSGGRVRLVAPTRLLAQQHHLDLADRAEALGLRCALYSGDLTQSERETVTQDKTIDILVGTHGLLSDAFAAEDFAVTILDEEQKFGAKLKAQGFDIHAGRAGNLLRLSATPIPSTIAETRIGLVEVSLISTYPTGRGATETLTRDDSDAALRALITEELARDGQVIALCSRIRDLKALRKRLQALFPQARIDRVHGRRKARANRKTMTRFRSGDLDILCATSMLETGINVANANLMLVFGAKRFGLAQLHQLRGRIGRGPKDARFVVLTHKRPGKGFALRLRALSQMSARGEGLQLALADSVLRGTGRLCDDEQSGHASMLGLELYEHLLSRAEAEMSAQDLLHAVPKIAGDAAWGFDDPDDLETLMQASRAALRQPDSVLGAAGPKLYPATIAACRKTGAVKAGIGPDGLVFVYPEAPTHVTPPTIEAVVELAKRT